MIGKRRALWCAIGVLALHPIGIYAQNSNPSSVTNPYFGSVSKTPVTQDVLKLSLDDAIRRGLENNLALTLAKQNEKAVEAQQLSAFQALLPNITFEAATGIHQYNLQATGFTPSFLEKIGQVMHMSTAGFDLVPTVNVTTAQFQMKQSLFSLQAYDLWRGVKVYQKAAAYDTKSSQNSVALTVGTTYLQAIAAASQLDYAKELLRADEVLLKQAVAEHEAGTASNLDELRARVQYQTQQQAVIAAENSLEKIKILLKREIGLVPEQQIALSDTAPYSELAPMSLDEAKKIAYETRQDYLSLREQVHAAELVRLSTKHERLPTVSFNGNYGVAGVTNGMYHGVFDLHGSINVPLFREAKFRGDREVAEAQLHNLESQTGDLRGLIDAQVRDSFLDLQSTEELVRVARSNMELATRALQDESDRFAAGIDDNLPLVEAQATLANAQTQLVQSLYRYNQAKLQFARNLGVVDSQYKLYLGK